MIPIHKKGKDRSKADSYRPISLTSCTGKLMERLINTRLTWYLEKEKILIPNQAGFRQHRSTEDQATYLAQEIEDAFQEKKLTLAVWVDLEKAFDKVWKKGLRLKMIRYGIRGQMLKWIGQYLTNRRARVQNQRRQSKKRIIKEGVPQGGVLSPTLFVIFMNDIMEEQITHIHGALYADDLVLWCSADHLATATVRMREALSKLENWTKQWAVSLNAKKTTYTIFSLSPKEQRAELEINGHPLPQDMAPTYLGVTYDPRLTWKHHINKCTTRAKLRLALMKKLSGTSWGADYSIQKKLYTGSIRPVLEYGITSWGTAAKANFAQVERVQNQASRIITGAMKSTPIHAMETLTGLQTLEDRRDTKILTQSAKYKRLEDHPMRTRMSDITKCRLKRSSFLHQSRRLERKNKDLLEHANKPIPTHSALPTWNRKQFPEIRESIPGIQKKGEQIEPERKAVTLEYIDQIYPPEEWTHAYTDGSAEEANKNGGGGIYLKLKNREEIKLAIPTGLRSSNYKAETEALKTAATTLLAHRELIHNRVVIFSDALSVLQATTNPHNKDLNELVDALHNLQLSTEKTVIQWIPSHCDIQGNEEADRLAKEGGKMPQTPEEISYEEAKTLIKDEQKKRWLQQHPNYNSKDSFYNLPRRDQVNMTRLRTGHCRLRHHMYTRFRIGDTPSCQCGAPQTVEHLLQNCPLHQNLRAEIWPEDTPLREKLYGPLESLRRTAAFVVKTEIPI